MIKVESITIENLRGIKYIHHDFKNGNLLIYGPNGSGKSGVIDAIEFALIGNICRLSGTGTAGITLSAHGPHVDFRNNTRKSKATVKLSNRLTGNLFIIERTVASLQKPKISPDNEEAQMIMTFLSEHPEFSLSRREILKFIVTEPSKRAKAVQEILKMDDVDKLRASFSKLNSEVKKIRIEKTNIFTQTKDALLQHFEIAEINSANVLKKVNAMRGTLNLNAIDCFSTDTKFSADIDSDKQHNKSTVDKKLLCTKISNLLKKLNEGEIFSSIEEARDSVSKMKHNLDFLQNINKQSFYESGLKFVSDNLCPFCDTIYDMQLLINHTREKIAANKGVTLLQKAIEYGCLSLKEDYTLLLSEISEIKRDAVYLGLSNEAENLLILSESLKLDCEMLNKPIDRLEEVSGLLQTPYVKFGQKILMTLKNIFDFAEKIHDFSSEEQARRFLIIADERLNGYKMAKQEKDLWVKREEITNELLSAFEKVAEKKLTDLYEDVEKDFSKFYSQINSDDEESFNAQLTHTKGSLNLEVDFYGRGVFPPNAFHSEGHQDGMGLCLYLALSKKIMGNRFTFCLLDDVLMSIDTNHRRQFCCLLKTEFPATQFIITTHDEVWKRQLINEGVVNSKQVINFRSWSVDSGPTWLNEKDTLEDLERCIKKGDILEAAPILRRYLEYIMTELSWKLRAKLELKPTNSYELGELSDSVIGRYKEFLKKAKIAANTWGRKEVLKRITSIDESLTCAIQKSKLEQWVLNPSIHYNEWANFIPSDFLLLKEAFFDLLEQFKCVECSSWFYASPPKGNIEEVRCECGNFLLNLREKREE